MVLFHELYKTDYIPVHVHVPSLVEHVLASMNFGKVLATSCCNLRDRMGTYMHDEHQRSAQLTVTIVGDLTLVWCSH